MINKWNPVIDFPGEEGRWSVWCILFAQLYHFDKTFIFTKSKIKWNRNDCMVNESDLNDTVLIGIADCERYTKNGKMCAYSR